MTESAQPAIRPMYILPIAALVGGVVTLGAARTLVRDIAGVHEVRPS